MFAPHKFGVLFYGVPTIQIREDVLHDMWHVTDLVQMEVGWFCTVKDMGHNVFLIDGMYLPAQECHAATTEITAAGEAKMMNDLIREEREAGVQPGDPQHKLNRLDAWFHSHADMDTTASGQDMDMMEKFRATGRPYFIRGIVNKKGKISLAFYESKSALKSFRIEDVPWEVVTIADPNRRARWQADVAAKVSRLGVTTAYPPYGGGMYDNWQGGQGYDDDGHWNRNQIQPLNRGAGQTVVGGASPRHRHRRGNFGEDR